jgi:hypothetical protein
MPKVRLNKTKAGKSISFGPSRAIKTLRKVTVKTIVSVFNFYIVPTSTLFLLYLKNIDNRSLKFRNTANILKN